MLSSQELTCFLFHSLKIQTGSKRKMEETLGQLGRLLNAVAHPQRKFGRTFQHCQTSWNSRRTRRRLGRWTLDPFVQHVPTVELSLWASCTSAKLINLWDPAGNASLDRQPHRLACRLVRSFKKPVGCQQESARCFEPCAKCQNSIQLQQISKVGNPQALALTIYTYFVKPCQLHI